MQRTLLVLIQVADKAAASSILEEAGISYTTVATLSKERSIKLEKSGAEYTFDINDLRDKWYKSSYLLDRKQSGEQQKAKERFEELQITTSSSRICKRIHGEN